MSDAERPPDADCLEVSIVGVPGHWNILIEINGEPWKLLGPWAGYDEAVLNHREVLKRAQKVAKNCWDEVAQKHLEEEDKKDG